MLERLTAGHPDQFIALAANMHAKDRAALVRTGLAVFDDPTLMTEAAAKLAAAGTAFERASHEPAMPAEPRSDVAAALAESGIALVEDMDATAHDDALDAQVRLGTIVLKLTAPDLHHKTEIGGVTAGLASSGALRDAHARLEAVRERHAAAFPGLTLIAQPHLDGTELLLTMRRDAHFGPLMGLGTGGVMVELFDDLTWAKPPVTPAQARAMLGRIRADRMFDGWRGRPALNRDRLAAAIAALSERIADLPDFEINPLIVSADGLFAVDLARSAA